MPPVKLGIIGCGIAARRHHWPALQQLSEQFDITVVCNRSEPKAREFAGLVGGVPYELDYRDVLRRDDVEAVDVILPFHLNYEVTQEALAAEKHVMVEKPLAAGLRDAEKMLALQDRYSRVMMVAENFYYHPVFTRVRALLQDGEIGKPYATFWDVFRHITPDNPYTKTRWRMSASYPGGFILDGGIHNVAVLHLLFGDIVSSRAWAKSVNPAVGGVDSFSMQFATEAGVHGVLNLLVSARDYAANRLVILGERGCIEVHDYRDVSLRRDGQTVVTEHFEVNESYRNEFQDFYRAIRNGTKVFSCFDRGYRDFKVLYESLQAAQSEIG